MAHRLLGQGTPLPPNCPHLGEWLEEEHLFIYEPDKTQLMGGAAPRFNVVWNTPSGNQCLGFDASHLAAALDIGAEELFVANREGRLLCPGTTNARPTHGGDVATRYIFKLGGKTAAIVVERLLP